MTDLAGPVTPKPMGPVGRLQLVIFLATVLNGFVVAGAWQLVTNWGPGDWVPTAVIGVLAIPGLLLAIRLPYAFLALFSPRPHLTLSAAGAPPGGAIQVSWRFSGAVARLRRVVFFLEGTAITSTRRATVDSESDVFTDSSSLGSYKLFEVEKGLGVVQGSRTFTVPEEAQPRVRGAFVSWTLKVRGDVQGLPDVDVEFPFRVMLKD